MRAPVAILFASLSLLGCDDATSPGVTIELIDPSGENAAVGVVEGTLSIELRQGETLLCTEGCDTEIRGGDFALALPIASLVDLTRIQGRISGADVPTTWGAVPPFAIAGEGLETAELPVRLVMLPPSRCGLLRLFNVSTEGRPRLVEPRRGAAAVVRRNVVLLAGGIGPGGGSSRIDFFDQVVVEMRPPLEPAPGPLGRTVGLAMSEDESLFVGDTAWIYVRQMGPPGATSVVLHAGADGSSALVLLGGLAGVIGGTGTSEISWITVGGTAVATGALSVERPGAIAARGAGEGALVVGGAPGGEWVAPNMPPRPFAGVPDASGGWLAVSPSGQSYLWIGATGTQTSVITGCPSACAVTDGPSWDRARDGASGTQTEAGAFWIVGGEGSDLIDIVRWEGETPSIEPGPTLSSGTRAGASVVEHASGVVLVIGGQRGTEYLSDVELCMPAALDPL